MQRYHLAHCGLTSWHHHKVTRGKLRPLIGAGRHLALKDGARAAAATLEGKFPSFVKSCGALLRDRVAVFWSQRSLPEVQAVIMSRVRALNKNQWMCVIGIAPACVTNLQEAQECKSHHWAMLPRSILRNSMPVTFPGFHQILHRRPIRQKSQTAPPRRYRT
jgi:hypothetical protein